MTDAPDPLGKRALFWAPAERDEDGPRHAAECDAPGKHALFSPEARAGAGRPHTRRSAGGATRTVQRPGGVGGGGGGGGAQQSLLSPITVECSSCGSRSEVRVSEFALLHLPVWLWRPGRGYTRFMTCPACRRRTWVSASWAPWAR
ncbi:MAG: hypothetical protein ABSG81_14535 [Acidimicrobiales bacterium]|jgi:hypothetical protein